MKKKVKIISGMDVVEVAKHPIKMIYDIVYKIYRFIDQDKSELDIKTNIADNLKVITNMCLTYDIDYEIIVDGKNHGKSQQPFHNSINQAI